MLLYIILIVDLVLLAVMIAVYIHYSFRERNLLQGQVGQAHELQQRIYQIQVLKEIGERIGYSLDTNKIVEIITSSLGNLLEYDTVSYMVLQENGEKLIFKCDVNNSVTHSFLDDVKEKKEVFPKFAKLSKPRNLQHHEEWKWLKFLGLIRPHKPKTEQNPVPKKEKRVKELQLPRMPVAAEPGTYHVILDDEGIGFPLVKKISKTTGNAVW